MHPGSVIAARKRYVTLSPLVWAERAYDIILSGVLCAETIVTSHLTPKPCRVLAAARIVAKSLSDPIMMPTSA